MKDDVFSIQYMMMTALANFAAKVSITASSDVGSMSSEIPSSPNESEMKTVLLFQH